MADEIKRRMATEKWVIERLLKTGIVVRADAKELNDAMHEFEEIVREQTINEQNDLEPVPPVKCEGVNYIVCENDAATPSLYCQSCREEKIKSVCNMLDQLRDTVSDLSNHLRDDIIGMKKPTPPKPRVG